MSAQAGLLCFDRRPIAPDIARCLLDSLAEYGPDGCGVFTAPGVVMVHQAMHVTPEDRHEKQPLICLRGNVITWDGRLDNRDDLIMQLWHDLADDRSDAALALCIYNRHGVAGLGRLTGDWSLAIWDASSNTLTLASDFAGSRALYYRCDDNRLYWSTSLRTLLGRLSSTPQPDTRFLVGFLTHTPPPEVTPYVGVHCLRPGHASTWSLDGRRQSFTLWTPASASIRHQDPRDYEHELRSLFSDAVQARLRSARPVWAELSGGLDSSGICCMADLLVREARVPTPRLETISYVSDLSPESDERRFIAVIEDQLQTRGCHVAIESTTATTDLTRAWITPIHPHGVSLAFLQRVRDGGGRVLLTGNPGDVVMGNLADYGLSGLDLPDMRSIAAWLAYGRRWSRSAKQPIWSAVAEAWRHTRSPRRFATSQLVNDLRRRARDNTASPQTAAARLYLLKPEAANLFIAEQHRRLEAIGRFHPLAKRPFVGSLLQFTETRLLQSPAEFAEVQQAHPYMHRPLVEYVLGIPAGALAEPGEPRSLMRRAFAGFMPARTLRRFSKGYASPHIVRNLRSVAADFLSRLDQLALVQLGIVDPDLLRSRLSAIQSGAAGQQDNLRELVRLERWFVHHANHSRERSQIPA
jgi:asparagine synthase (glutamine-hydrolysing)